MGFRIFSGKCVLVACSLLFLSACANDADPDALELLGTPPSTANLGVEYVAFIGSTGGLESINNFTLSNAPDWLTLQLFDNAALQGVLLNGVPGVTGGGNGLDDVGEFEDIVLSVTDGSNVETVTFNITVSNNTVSAPGSIATEAATTTTVLGCETPEETLERLDAEAELDEDAPVTGPEFAITQIPVTLSSPLLAPVEILFEVTSGSADVGIDFSLVEADSLANSGVADDGVTLIAADTNQATLRFDTGQNLCHITLAIEDDAVAEPVENYFVEILEVNEGFIDLEDSGSVTTITGSIVDNEPIASLQASSQFVSEGSLVEVTISIEGGFNASISGSAQQIPIEVLTDATTDADAADFSLGIMDGGTFTPLPTDSNGFALVDFTPATAPDDSDEPTILEASFLVRAEDDGDSDNPTDEQIRLAIGTTSTDLAEAPTDSEETDVNDVVRVVPADNEIIIFINEWVAPVTVDTDSATVVDDIAIDSQDNVYVMTTRTGLGGGDVQVDLYDRLGALVDTLLVSLPGDDQGVGMGVQLDATSGVVRGGVTGTETDFNLFIAFNSTSDLPSGPANQGGFDIVIQQHQRTEFVPDGAVTPTDVSAFTLIDQTVLSTADDDIAADFFASASFFSVAGSSSGIENTPAFGGTDAFVVNFNSAFEVTLAETVGSAGNETAATVNPIGANTFLTGTTDNLISLTDIDLDDDLGAGDAFQVGFDTNDGEVALASQFGTVGADTVAAAEPLGAGLLLAGTTTAAFTEFSQTSAGGIDLFVRSFINSIEVDDDTLQFGSGGNDIAFDLENVDGNYTLVGATTGALGDSDLFGGTGAIAPQGQDGFVARIVAPQIDGDVELEVELITQLQLPGDDAVTAVEATDFGKLFIVLERDGATPGVIVFPINENGEALVPSP